MWKTDWYSKYEEWEVNFVVERSRKEPFVPSETQKHKADLL